MSGNVLEKNKRFRADGQNTAQNYTIMRVMMTMQYWTVIILPEEVEIAVAALKKGSLSELIICEQSLFRLPG